MADDRERQVAGDLPGTPSADQVGVVVARVVADQHVVDPRSEATRGSGRGPGASVDAAL